MDLKSQILNELKIVTEKEEAAIKDLNNEIGACYDLMRQAKGGVIGSVVESKLKNDADIARTKRQKLEKKISWKREMLKKYS